MGKNIKTYKNEFAINFAKMMQEKLHHWQKIKQIYKAKLYSLPALGFYLIIIAASYVPARNEHHYDLFFHSIAAIIMFFIAFAFVLRLVNKAYQNAIKKTLFPNLLKIFGYVHYYCPSKVDHRTGFFGDSWMTSMLQGTLKSDKVQEIIHQIDTDNLPICHNEIPNYIIKDSLLLNTDSVEVRNDDDCFWGKYGGVDFKINETNMGYFIRNKNGKQYRSIFKGLVMQFRMNKAIQSRILIYKKGLIPKNPGKRFERVSVESPEFQKKYEVFVEKDSAAGGQIEARYFLTSLMLDRFMHLQTSFGIPNMKCSIYGDSIIILLSTNKDLFEMNQLLGKIDDINQYKHIFDEFISVLSFIEVLNLASKSGM